MPAKDKDTLGEYDAAMLLPDGRHTGMLHRYAEQYMAEQGGDYIKGALHTAQLMRGRWELDLRRVGEEGFRPFVGSREAARMCVLTESLQGKLTALRNRAYRFARAALFHRDGVRIDFPTWHDDAPVAITPEPVAEAAPEPVTAAETETAATDRLVVKREVKAVLQRLHNQGVKGSALQAFKQRCLAGNVTEGQMREWARELVAAAA